MSGSVPKQSEIREAELQEIIGKRVSHGLIAYLAPFRIVEQGLEKAWSATIDEINRGSWDYSALCELVGSIDIGLPQGMHCLVTRDGGFCVPPMCEFRSEQSAVAMFNRCFAALLLGGVYCEAIGVDGVGFSRLYDRRYARDVRPGSAGGNTFHDAIRHGQLASRSAIVLHHPRVITIQEIASAADVGFRVLSVVPEMDGEFLLKGITNFARRDWTSAVSNLWIVVEQITSNLWARDVIIPLKNKAEQKSRVDQLDDNRTWSMAPRLELLCQINSIDTDVLAQLSIARRARNALAHEGRPVEKTAALAAFGGIISLLSKVVGELDVPLSRMNLDDHTLTDPFAPQVPIENPTHWMAIPKLPGESEIEGLQIELRKLKSRREEK